MKVDIYENKSINDIVRLNFFYNEEKDDKYLWELLNGVIDVALKNNLNLQKELLKNYEATIKLDRKSFGNKNLMYIQIENLNKNFTRDGEDITLDCAKILFDFVCNIKKYLETVTLKQYYSLVKGCNKIFEKTKDSLYSFLYTNTKSKEIALNNVTLEKVKEYANRIFNNSSLYLQMITNKKVADEILNSIDFKSLEKNEINKEKVSFANLDFYDVYNEEKSKKLATEIDFIMQRKNLELNSEIFTKNQLLAKVISLLVFDVVREENSLSYNPSSCFNINYNFMYIRANFHESNKFKVETLIAKCIKDIENGDFNEKLLDYAKIQLGDLYNLENYKINKKSLNDAINELYEFNFDLELMKTLTKQDIINHLKTFKIKLIYYLGGR